MVLKKPAGKPTSPVQDHLSPVEEFPPPPPPHDFSSNSADIIMPPPTFEVNNQSAYTSQSLSPPSLSPPVYPSAKSEPVHHQHVSELQASTAHCTMSVSGTS